MCHDSYVRLSSSSIFILKRKNCFAVTHENEICKPKTEAGAGFRVIHEQQMAEEVFTQTDEARKPSTLLGKFMNIAFQEICIKVYLFSWLISAIVGKRKMLILFCLKRLNLNLSSWSLGVRDLERTRCVIYIRRPTWMRRERISRNAQILFTWGHVVSRVSLLPASDPSLAICS